MEGPKIAFNYMETDQDKNEMREGIKLTREILAQPSFQSFAGKELSPGEGVQSDAEIDAFVRKNGESAYHQLVPVEWEMTRNLWLTQKVRFTGWRTCV